MPHNEAEINRIALALEFGGSVAPEIMSRIIEVHEAVIADVIEELERPDLRAQFAGKFVGLASVMKSVNALEGIYPNISPYIAQRVEEQLGLDKPI